MEDSHIVTLLNEGDKEAYKQLFITYYSPLTEYATQFIADADAEELVQDMMLFIWEYRQSIVIESSLKSYLFTSVRNRCLNAIRRRQYHARIHSIIYEKLREEFEDPDYYLVNELSAEISKAVDELPDVYRETFTLSRFGELTNKQVAEHLGVSVKTVEYRISQSLKILRRKLRDYLITFIV